MHRLSAGLPSFFDAVSDINRFFRSRLQIAPEGLQQAFGVEGTRVIWVKRNSMSRSRKRPVADAGTAGAEAGRNRTVVELAGLRRRLASMLYESMLLMGVLALTFLVPYLMLGVGLGIAPPGWLAWLHIFLVLGFYFVWYWRRNGQTLAMQTWRLKVVDAGTGLNPDARRAWLRYVFCWPSLLCLGAGLIWAVFDRDRQFLHDRLAGTRVVLLPGQPNK